MSSRTPELVEAVARAIWDTARYYEKREWRFAPESARNHYCDKARAAIAALPPSNSLEGGRVGKPTGLSQAEPASRLGPSGFDPSREEDFLSRLSELCRQHGFGIEGGVVYLMEGDDYLFDYQIDEAGRLVRGVPFSGAIDEITQLRRERDEAVRALADYRAQQYAPWAYPGAEDTIGEMIDNQAWVMLSHIASYVGHRDGDPDLMERWQDDWAENYPSLLTGWFSPHRAAAKYVAERLTIRDASAGEAGTAETPKSGSVHEHAVGEAETPESGIPSNMIGEAIEALEPFAKAADVKLCGEWRDDQHFGQTDVGFYLTFGDLRKARATLSKLRGEG